MRECLAISKSEKRAVITSSFILEASSIICRLLLLLFASPAIGCSIGFSLLFVFVRCLSLLKKRDPYQFEAFDTKGNRERRTTHCIEILINHTPSITYKKKKREIPSSNSLPRSCFRGLVFSPPQVIRVP